LFPSAFAVLGGCFTQRFHALALSALRFSQPFSGSLRKPFGFISPRSALGIFLQSFLLQEIFYLFRGFFCPLAVGCFAYVFRVLRAVPDFLLRICSSASGFCTLLKLVHIDSVVNLFYGRCSPGFQPSSGGSCSLFCALPTKIFVGVVPLLRRLLS
jgi:hypothetical protein